MGTFRNGGVSGSEDDTDILKSRCVIQHHQHNCGDREGTSCEQISGSQTS